ncbi:MAG TPA: hypothetical protein VGI75_09485 [Pirellulales bacterium]
MKRSIKALRQTTVLSDMPNEVKSSTLLLLEAQRVGSTNFSHYAGSSSAPSSKRKSMFRKLKWVALATAVLLLVGGISWRGIGERDGSTAFGQVAENMKNATSVRIDAHYRHAKDSGPSVESLKAYVQGDLLRLDIFSDSYDLKGQPDKILAIDLKKRTGWEIDQTQKTYKSFPLNDDAIKLFGKPMSILTKLTDKNAEFIGDETLEGRKVRAYRLLPGEFQLQDWKIEKGDVVKVWVDPSSGLPIRIEGDFLDPNANQKVHALYDLFQWNQPIETKLFELEVPQGFKLQDQSAAPHDLPIFAKMLENVKSLTSVTYTITQRITPEAVLIAQVYCQGSMERVELPGKQPTYDHKIPFDVVALIDYQKNEDFQVNYLSKIVWKNRVDSKAPQDQFADIVQAFRNLTEKDAEQIHEEDFMRTKTVIYRLLRATPPLGGGQEIDASETAKVWVDVESKLPVLMYFERFNANRTVKNPVTLGNFEWNQPLDSKIFTLDVPEGFEVKDERLKEESKQTQ